MKKEINGTITWLQINNWVPIITSAIFIALSWAALNTQIQLLAQKQQDILVNQRQMLENQQLYLDDLNTLHGRIVKLETIVEMK